MADEIINVDLIINTAESARNLGELRKGMGDVRSALDKVAIGSKDFGRLNAALDDGALRLKTFRRGFDGMQAFATFGNTIASSFGLASGVIAQFAGNNDELQKSLTKVASALTIVQSFARLAEEMKAAKEANLALNATLLTNPYVLVAAGIGAAALALVSYGDDTEETKKKTEDLIKANEELANSYLALSGDILDVYDEKVAILNATQTDQKTILEETVKIRQEEFDAILKNQNLEEDGIRIKRQDITLLKERILNMQREGVITNSQKVEEKRLQDVLKQTEAEYKLLFKAQQDLLSSKKDLLTFKPEEVKNNKEVAASVKFYSNEITNLIDVQDAYLTSQVKIGKASQATLDAFRKDAKDLQLILLDVDKNITEVFTPMESPLRNDNILRTRDSIKKLDEDFKDGRVSADDYKNSMMELKDQLGQDIMGGGAFNIGRGVEQINKGLEETIKLIKVDNFANFSDLLESVTNTANKFTQVKVGFLKTTQDLLINDGVSLEQTVEIVDNVFSQIKDGSAIPSFDKLASDAKEKFKLTSDQAELFKDVMIKSFEKVQEGIVKFSKYNQDNPLLIKIDQNKIKEYETELNSLTTALKRQEEVSVAVGVTSEQLANQKYDDIIKIIKATEALSERVKDSILPDDEKSKKMAELSLKVEEYRHQLELLGIELGKPKELGLSEIVKDEISKTQKALQLFSDFASGLNQIFTQQAANEMTTIENNAKAATDAISTQLELGYITDKQYKEKKAALDAQYEEERKQAQKQAWRDQKAAAIITATINTANAVINGLNTVPFIPLGVASAATAGILGAAQIAVIASQPEPSFAKGGYIHGAGGPTDDAISANLSSGEYVVNAKSTSAFLPLLQAVNAMGVNRGMNQMDPLTTSIESKTVVTPSIPTEQKVKVNLVWKDLDDTTKTAGKIKARTTF